jgi:LysR family transcriptional regulator, mexEF-oprN operon transcriptional activator
LGRSAPNVHLHNAYSSRRDRDHFDLRSFDLNLLIAFDALIEERSVTRAAARLRVRQPAMSHSLSVLRMLLQDELFVRDGSIMRPTARALNIAPAVRSTLRQMEGYRNGFA